MSITSCGNAGDVTDSSPSSASQTDFSDEESVQIDDEQVLNETEAEQYEQIKEKLPELLGTLNFKKCTVSTPVYTFYTLSNQNGTYARFFVIAGGDIVSAIDVYNDDVSLTYPVDEQFTKNA